MGPTILRLLPPLLPLGRNICPPCSSSSSWCASSLSCSRSRAGDLDGSRDGHGRSLSGATLGRGRRRSRTRFALDKGDGGRCGSRKDLWGDLTSGGVGEVGGPLELLSLDWASFCVSLAALDSHDAVGSRSSVWPPPPASSSSSPSPSAFVGELGGLSPRAALLRRLCLRRFSDRVLERPRARPLARPLARLLAFSSAACRKQ